MKWTTATLSVLIVGTLLLAGRVLLRPPGTSPRETIDAVRAAQASGIIDSALLLRDLDRSLRVLESAPETDNSRNLRAEAFFCRAQLQGHLGEYDQAIADVRASMEITGESPMAHEILLIELHAQSGFAEDALASAQRWTHEHPDHGPGHGLAGRIASELAEQQLSLATESARAALMTEGFNRATPLMRAIAAKERTLDEQRPHLAVQLNELFEMSKGRDSASRLTSLHALLNQASHYNTIARRHLAKAIGPSSTVEEVALLLQLFTDAQRFDLCADLGSRLLARPEPKAQSDQAAMPTGGERPSTDPRDLGVLERLRSSARLYTLCLQAMTRLGQDRRASNLIRGVDWESLRPDTELCTLMASHLFRTKEWQRLGPAISRLNALKDKESNRIATFFEGFSYEADARVPGQALAKTPDLSPTPPEVGSKRYKKLARARDAMLNYVRSRKPATPIPYAKLHGRMQLARIYRHLGRDALEHESLGGVLSRKTLRSTPGWIRHLTCEDFLRYGHLSSVLGDKTPLGTERMLTQAMSMAPERTEEFRADWAEKGQESLAQKNNSLDALEARMRLRNLYVPGTDVGPWALLELGKRHLAGGIPAAGKTIGRLLLEEYPHLLPAIDLYIESQIAQGSTHEVYGTILLRISLVGGDSKSNDYLNEFSANELSSAQRKDLIVSDPSSSGRFEVASHFLATGQPQRALATLAPQAAPSDPEAPRSLPKRLQILRAQALTELDRFSEASELLTPLVGDPDFGGTALVHLAKAQLGSSQDDALAPLVELIVDTLGTPNSGARGIALQVADHLLAGSQPHQAGLLLEGLDSTPELRGADVLERLALAAAQRGDVAAMEEALERAEAFLGDGGAELIRILHTVETRNWPALPTQIAALERTNSERTPLTHAILSLLGERLESGFEQARMGASAQPTSPAWAIVLSCAQALTEQPIEVDRAMGKRATQEMHLFLRGVDGARRDPRMALALILAIEREGWATWALPRILDVAQEGGGVQWPSLLGASALENLGQLEESRRLYESCTEGFPRCVSGWDGLIRLRTTQTGSPVSRDVLALRAKRARSFRRSEPALGLDSVVDSAGALHLAGDHQGAVDLLVTALSQGAPGHHPARLLLARLHAELEQWSLATSQYGLILASLPPTPGHPLLAEYLELLQRASAEGQSEGAALPSRTVRTLLSAQAKHFRTDPAIYLAQAQLSLQREDSNPTLGAELALGIFSDFRNRSKSVPVDNLRQGYGLLWANLLIQIRPSVAAQFIAHDLTAHPGDVDLWKAYAQSLQATGDIEQEAEIREAIAIMNPCAESHLDHAEMLVRTQASLRDLDKALAKAERTGSVDAKRPHTQRIQFLRNVATLEERGGLSADRGAIQGLRKLWGNRGKLTGVDETLLGRYLSLGLMIRQDPQDLDRLPGILQQLRSSQGCDPYTRAYAFALEGLSQTTRATLPVQWLGSEPSKVTHPPAEIQDGTSSEPNQPQSGSDSEDSKD